MDTNQVYEIEMNGAFRPIGPYDGFTEEANARAYARSKAESWTSRAVYAVVGPSGLVAVYPGKLIGPPTMHVGAGRIFESDDGEENFDLPNAA